MKSSPALSWCGFVTLRFSHGSKLCHVRKVFGSKCCSDSNAVQNFWHETWNFVHKTAFKLPPCIHIYKRELFFLPFSNEPSFIHEMCSTFSSAIQRCWTKGKLKCWKTTSFVLLATRLRLFVRGFITLSCRSHGDVRWACHNSQSKGSLGKSSLSCRDG